MLKKIQHRSNLLILLCCFIIAGASVTTARAADDITASYNYSFWGNAVANPAAYQATTIWNGDRLGVGAFKDPNDLYVTEDQMIYVLDSGNHRVVVLDDQYQPITTIDSFKRDGKSDTFLNPQGIFVTEQKHVLIADTGNNRIVHLDSEYNFVALIEEPESDLFQSTFEFKPVRLVMDKAQRIYVMSTGVFDGLMEFSSDGTFTSFIGANRVWIDPIELLWKRLSTQQQRSQMVMFTPTEFTNLDIDEEGFIYATNGDQWGDTIKKLNAQGSDILRREGHYRPLGDIRYSIDSGPSRLIDIDVTDSEIYSVLDSRQGRIFTYNGDGHLMYVFGGRGNKLGQFNTPVAIERVGDDFLVLDKALGEITVFQTTEYGRLLNEAVRSYYRGEEEKAYELFNQTIQMNANLEFAYSGIGKALLRQGDYEGALHYFEQSIDRNQYSKAFLLYRKQVLRESFPTIMTLLLVFVLGALIFKRYLKMARRKKGVSIE